MSVFVLNAVTFGLSEYEGWVPIGLAEHEGSVFVAQTDGLYENVGADDDGTDIDTILTTGRLDFGAIMHFKHIHRVMATLANATDVEVTLYSVDRNGETTYGPYTMEALSVATPGHRVTRTPRGPEGQFWKVKITNVSGGAIDLRSLSLNAERTRMVL